MAVVSKCVPKSRASNESDFLVAREVKSAESAFTCFKERGESENGLVGDVLVCKVELSAPLFIKFVEQWQQVMVANANHRACL